MQSVRLTVLARGWWQGGYCVGKTVRNVTGNYWTTMNDWPAYSPTKYYFHEGALLTTQVSPGRY